MNTNYLSVIDNIPMCIDDMGYFDISLYQLSSLNFLQPNLAIRLEEGNNNKKGIIIKLENIVAYNNKIHSKCFSSIRIDNGGSSFGLDISTRLKQDVFADYKVLYLYEDSEHTSYAFRALAEKIFIQGFDNKHPSIWPYE